MKKDSKKITYLPCGCGGKMRGRGRLLECSNRSCGVLVMRKTREQAIKRWNKIMNDLTNLKQGN